VFFSLIVTIKKINFREIMLRLLLKEFNSCYLKSIDVEIHLLNEKKLSGIYLELIEKK